MSLYTLKYTQISILYTLDFTHLVQKSLSLSRHHLHSKRHKIQYLIQYNKTRNYQTIITLQTITLKFKIKAVIIQYILHFNNKIPTIYPFYRNSPTRDINQPILLYIAQFINFKIDKITSNFYCNPSISLIKITTNSLLF